jgi:hypothetical protein
MAKKKAKPAKKAAPKKGKAAKKPVAKKAVTKKRAVKKSAPVKKAAKKKSAPKKKAVPPKKAPRQQPPAVRASHVKIDHVTQGPDGSERSADRLSIRTDDFLWVYLEADLPNGAAPQGEYAKTAGGSSASPQHLAAPEVINGQYRFMVIHYALSPDSTYLFRFADNLTMPTYQDQWEIVTVPR